MGRQVVVLGVQVRLLHLHLLCRTRNLMVSLEKFVCDSSDPPGSGLHNAVNQGVLFDAGGKDREGFRTQHPFDTV